LTYDTDGSKGLDADSDIELSTKHNASLSSNQNLDIGNGSTNMHLDLVTSLDYNINGDGVLGVPLCNER
jgi:hypothetical protein